MEQIKVSDVIWKQEVYPREKVNQNKATEYENFIEVLPPIIINQDNILVDGAHRLQAFKNTKQEFIPCEKITTIDDDDLLLKAIELNATHGYQMTQKEKKQRVVKFYEKVLNGDAETFDTSRLKKAFSLPESTFSRWTRDMAEKLESIRLEKVLNLYLQNKTHQEIADIDGLWKRTTITDKINEMEAFCLDLSENSEWEIPTKYSFFKDKIATLSEFQPKLYNIWNQSKNNNETKHFGNFPQEFMENLIHYYTKPFDLVYDPFAGGGVTIDACSKWLRKYYVSDMTPIETREEIKKWKIQDGLPSDLKEPQLVFLDPPYWIQAENQYSDSKQDLGNMKIEEFYESMNNLIKELKKKMKTGYVALVIQGTQWKNNYKLEDHAIKLYNLFEKNGFTFEQRIILPYSTEQYNAQQVIKAKENKFMLTIYRDLIVFKKGD